MTIQTNRNNLRKSYCSTENSGFPLFRYTRTIRTANAAKCRRFAAIVNRLKPVYHA